MIHDTGAGVEGVTYCDAGSAMTVAWHQGCTDSCCVVEMLQDVIGEA